MGNAQGLARRLKQRAIAEGFLLAGIASPRPSDHDAFYRRWLADGYHGEMEWMARADAVARRGDLGSTLRGVRSVLVVADGYYREDAPRSPQDPARAIVARYARGRDYHSVVATKLERVLRWLEEEAPGVEGRVYVDTGPILERELARRAGLGWFGRNTMLIHPGKGSYFLLGVLLLDLDLPPDEPFAEDRCGTCRACLDACPTGALLGRDADGAPVIDARRCISYLTIELKGSIPRELRPRIGNRVFGCDICQEVCPWNARFAEPVREAAYRAREGLDGSSLVELAERILAMSGKEYLREFRDSPLSRPRRSGMLRNLCVALGNLGSPAAVATLAVALSDTSPLVRSHAAWALGRIGSTEAVGLLRERSACEPDPSVREELREALAGFESGRR